MLPIRRGRETGVCLSVFGLHEETHIALVKDGVDPHRSRQQQQRLSAVNRGYSCLCFGMPFISRGRLFQAGGDSRFVRW